MSAQSVVMVCADADKASCNPALAAFNGDAVGADNLAAGLSASGSAPATHWAGAAWLDAAHATAVKDWPSGVLPDPAAPWGDYGLTSAQALAAGSALTVSVMTASPATMETLPMTNFDATVAALGLQRVVIPRG